MAKSRRSSTPLEQTECPFLGVTIGSRYRIIEKLGSGAMGDVYLAEDIKLGRRVAAKAIRTDITADATILSRFERECHLHAKIGVHPHIVAFFDLIEDNQQLHLVMEYIEGQSLESYLRRCDEPLPIEIGVEIAIQCLRGLAHMHRHGVVHRDIKPPNIMLVTTSDQDLCAKLTDFGIARLAADESAGSTLTAPDGRGPGTPLYMAPEQIDSETFGETGPLSDVYSMGVVLYRLLAGHPPFEGSLTDVLNAHLSLRPRPITQADGDPIPPLLTAAVNKALAKQPSKRFDSCESFIAALEACRNRRRSDRPQRVYDRVYRLSQQVQQIRGGMTPKRTFTATTVVAFVAIVGLIQILSPNAPETNRIARAEEAPMPEALRAGPRPVPIPAQKNSRDVDRADPDSPPPVVSRLGAIESPEFEPEPHATVVQPLLSEFQEFRPYLLDWPIEQPPESSPSQPLEIAKEPVDLVIPENSAQVDTTAPETISVASNEVPGQLDSAGPAAAEIPEVPDQNSADEPVSAVDLEGEVYTVESGDTLFKIAQKFNLDSADLARWNALKNPNALSVGQTLYLYERPETPNVEPNWDAPAPGKKNVFQRAKRWLRKISF